MVLLLFPSCQSVTTVLLLVFGEMIMFIFVSLKSVFDCRSERILFLAIYDSFLAAFSSLYFFNFRYKTTDSFRLYLRL
jgi:hypothetical protein